MAATKNITLWFERFNLLKEYVEEFNKLPSSTTEYREIKIGSWLQNQRVAYKNGKLPEECSQALNDAYPFWNSSLKEVNEGNKNLLINSNWKDKVIEGKVPIDEVFSGDKLYDYLNMGIYDLETLLNSKGAGLDNFIYFKCLSKVIPIINERYAPLLMIIKGQPRSSLTEMGEFFYSFCVSSAEEMQDKMNKMLESLTEIERDVLRIRYALNVNADHYATLAEAGRIFNVTSERIGQIEAKAIRKLRNPARLDIIKKAGNILDDASLIDVRPTLYRKGINSIDDIRNLIEDENTSSELKETLKKFIKIYEERNNEQRKINIQNILNKPLDELELSTRSYNCLKRAGYDTVKKVVKVFNDKEKVLKIRNFGIYSINEVEYKLKSLGIYGLEIEDEKLEDQQPKTKSSDDTKPLIKIDLHHGIKDDYSTIKRKTKEYITDIIYVLYRIANGERVYNNSPQKYIEHRCRYIYLTNSRLNEDISLSNIISCAMVYVREPNIYENKLYKDWVMSAICMYQYLNNNVYIKTKSFCLKDSLIKSLKCEWLKHTFISPEHEAEINEKVKRGEYEKDYLIKHNIDIKFPVQRAEKTINTQKMFFIFAYDFLRNHGDLDDLKKLFPKFTEIDKMLNDIDNKKMEKRLDVIDSCIDFYRDRIPNHNDFEKLEHDLYKVILLQDEDVDYFYRYLDNRSENYLREYIDNIDEYNHTFVAGDQVHYGYANFIVIGEKTPEIITCIDIRRPTSLYKFRTYDFKKEDLKIGWVGFGAPS